MLKKVNALILSVAVLLAVGCGKEDDSDKVQPAPEGNFKSCRIKTSKQDTTTTNYFYDSQGRMIQTQSGGGYSEKFIYNSLGKVSTYINMRSAIDTNQVRVYEYDPDSLLIKITSRSGVHPTWGNYEITYVTTLVYNSQKQVITMFTDLKNGPDIKRSYTYLPNNKLKIESFEQGNQNAWILNAETEMTFDNKKRPWDKNDVYSSVVDHNEVATTSKFYNNGTLAYSHSRITTHTYNSAGYPTESISVTDGQWTSVDKYEYDCQ